ncbi:MAG: hypothetical protein J6D33_08210 [Turicibacter sp.]|nr:hypothetical protein [Turicibacter sp.]
MTKEEQFEPQLDSLILLKALLIRESEFDEAAKKGIMSCGIEHLSYCNRKR